jgi:hypothetical protein
MNRLFTKTYQDYYNDLFGELKIKIASELDDFIIAQPTEDLVRYYLSYTLRPIELDPENEETISHTKSIKTILAHEREFGYEHDGDLRVESESIIVTLPIIPNKDISKIMSLRTQSISLSGDPHLTFKGNSVVIAIEIKGYGVNLDDEQITNYIIKTRSALESFLSGKNSEIMTENEKMKNRLAQFVNERKLKLDADKQRIQNLVKLTKISLARKDGDIVQKIRLEKKPFVKTLRPTTPDEEYLLDREKVVDIIKLISSQCLQFEKTPKTYSKLDEQSLRDLLLSNLNSIFQGQATGETFNNKGKTDIYLNIDKGNILIAECKFYGGAKLYHETIDQILGYLTWRQNFGIMISFCKQMNFTKVLSEAEATIKAHPTYDSGFKIFAPAHLISKHTLPTDDYKYVEIHHLYYNLYNK